jgi:hypothetical protein
VPLAHLPAAKIEHDFRCSYPRIKAAELKDEILKLTAGQSRLHWGLLEESQQKPLRPIVRLVRIAH